MQWRGHHHFSAAAAVLGAALLGLPGAPCHAQDEGRPGCSATLDEAKFGKARPAAKKYKVTVQWRAYPGGIEALAHATGGAEVLQDWHPAGFGWLPLDYGAALYYRVSYGPAAGYTLGVMIPELGSETCTWEKK